MSTLFMIYFLRKYTYFLILVAYFFCDLPGNMLRKAHKLSEPLHSVAFLLCFDRNQYIVYISRKF
jgi:hypothetical protein